MRTVVWLALLLLVPLWAGCLGDDAGEPAPEETFEDATRPQLVAPQFLPPVRLGEVCCAAEPNIAVGPDGRVFVSTTAALWRSDDGGRSYVSLNGQRCRVQDLPAPCPLPYDRHDGLDGEGDTDIVVTPDGAVHWLALFGEGGTVPYQVSHDGGATFSAAVDLADGPDADREWISARADGTLYATWRSFDKTDGLAFRRSADNGASWSDAVVIDEDHLQGPIAVDPSGPRLYTPLVPYTYDGAVRVARSSDDGATWETVEAVAPDGVDRSNRQRNPTYIFPVAAVDDAGHIYLVWADDADGGLAAGVKELSIPSVWLSTSRDGGTTWSKKVRLSDPGRPSLFPWIDAGAEGRIVVAWYENTHGLPNELFPDLWNVRVVMSVDADATEPRFAGGFANTEPFHVGAICTDGGGCNLLGLPVRHKDRSMLDFFEVEIGEDGLPVVAWAADAPERRGRVSVFAGGVAAGTPLR